MKIITIGAVAFTFLPFLSICNVATAQTANNNQWSREVKRRIEIKPEASDKQAGKNATLGELLVNAVKQKQLTPYSRAPSLKNKMLPTKALSYLIDSVSETVRQNGKEVTRLVAKERDMSAVSAFSIYESWNYDQKTGKAIIQITGIAPSIPITSVAGMLMGYFTPF